MSKTEYLIWPCDKSLHLYWSEKKLSVIDYFADDNELYE